MIFEKCVLFCDIDGTLSTYKRTIPKENVEAINYFIDNGGKFALATGRAVGTAKKVIDQIRVNTPCIIYNGGEIYDFETGKSFYCTLLPKDAKKHIPEAIEKFPDVGVEIHIDRTLYCIKRSERSVRHIMNENGEFKIYNLDDLSTEKWHKVLITGSKEVIDEVAEYYKDKSTDTYYFLRSEEGLFEILPIDASKGKAIKKYSEIFNTDIENIYAIGDYYNDVEMLKAAGYSALTGDSPEDLRAIARYITCNCEDGAVADFIHHIETLMKDKKISEI